MTRGNSKDLETLKHYKSVRVRKHMEPPEQSEMSRNTLWSMAGAPGADFLPKSSGLGNSSAPGLSRRNRWCQHIGRSQTRRSDGPRPAKDDYFEFLFQWDPGLWSPLKMSVIFLDASLCSLDDQLLLFSTYWSSMILLINDSSTHFHSHQLCLACLKAQEVQHRLMRQRARILKVEQAQKLQVVQLSCVSKLY